MKRRAIPSFTEKQLKGYWNHIVKTDTCWLWDNPTHEQGYGLFTAKPNGKNLLAHRVAYALAYGEPGDFEVCHSCDVTSCVNPNHLFIGTQADNIQDMINKGRKYRILNDNDVIDIIASSATANELSERYGVTAYHIQRIRRNA